MVTRTALNNWYNGNFSELSKSDLIQIAKYFERYAEDEVIEDCED